MRCQHLALASLIMGTLAFIRGLPIDFQVFFHALVLAVVCRRCCVSILSLGPEDWDQDIRIFRLGSFQGHFRRLAYKFGVEMAKDPQFRELLSEIWMGPLCDADSQAAFQKACVEAVTPKFVDPLTLLKNLTEANYQELVLQSNAWKARMDVWAQIWPGSCQPNLSIISEDEFVI